MSIADLFNPTTDDFIPTVLGRTLRAGYRRGLISDLLTMDHFSSISLFVNEGFHIGIVSELNSYNHPNRTAVVDEHRSLNYQEFNDEVNQIAHLLQDKFDVDASSNVLVMMENRAEYLATWMALSRLRASTVHTSYRLKPDELDYQVNHSEGSIVFVSEKSADSALEVQDELGSDNLRIVDVDNKIGGDEIYQYHHLREEYSSEYPEPSDADEASNNVVYTSGTTGKPKAATREIMSPDTWVEQVKMLSEMTGLLEVLPMDTGDRQMIVTPVYHSAGQAFSLLQMLFAGTVYLRPKFEAEDTLRKLSEWDINNIFMVPTLIRRLCDLPENEFDRYTFDELKGIITSAAPFPQPLREEAIDRFRPEVIHELYGATELGLITHIDGNGMLERPNSVGQPLAGQEVKIVGENGEELPPNEVGEIYVRNEETIDEYVDNPEATEEILDGSWMTCEDLGYLDEDNYLYLTGRSRDMVITGGVNVYPVEVEEALEEHDEVHETAVTGVDHEEWGEMLICYVVPENEDVDIDSLVEFASERLHRAKVPKEWFTIDELPRTDTGKVMKRKLEEQYEEDKQ